MSVTRIYEIPERGSYEIIVAGGGVAGVAAAYTAAREGKRVLLIEKSVMLGGLATLGLITLFVPMCNGRGRQIIRGLADEFMRLAIKYGFDTIPEDWKQGEPKAPTGQRLKTRYDTGMFALSERLLCDAGVDILYDTIVTDVVMEGNFCRGLVVENKSGKSYYGAGAVIDATGSRCLACRPAMCCGQEFLYHGPAQDNAQ